MPFSHDQSCDVFSEPLKAAQCFSTAREGVSTERFLRVKLLQTEETDVRKLEVVYYLKVREGSRKLHIIWNAADI